MLLFPSPVMAMKSYYLEDLDDDVAAGAVLTEMLPRQSKPWVLFNAAGDKDIVNAALG